MKRIAELEFALRFGFAVPLDQVTAEEFHAIAISSIERQEYERELARRPPQT